MNTDHTQTEGELERLRAELSLTQRSHSDAVYALGQIADAYGVPFPDADAHFLIEEMPGVARSRVAEHVADMAALIRVRALCEAKEDAQRRANERYAERNIVEAKTGRVFEGVPILTCREVRAALDPTSPAVRPDSATAGDMGTRAGSAPSEGHSEAPGHATRTELRYVCGKCGQQRGGFHKGCDGPWIEQRRTVSEWWS